MCGIVGILAKDYDSDHLRDDLGEAVRLLRHRGPDDQGTWMNGSGVAVGPPRVSNLDQWPHGPQPMLSPDGRHRKVFKSVI